MGSEPIAHEGERNNCFGKIHYSFSKISRQNNFSYKKNAIQPSLFWFSKPAFGFQSGL